MTKDRVELTWAGKRERARVRRASLEQDPALSAGGPDADGAPSGLLVRGDCLEVMRAMLRDRAGSFACAYLDPPYNTGATFAHYDDARGHGAWLGFLRDRLLSVRALLRDDGWLFVSIGDDEAAYLTVLLDEIMGRKNRAGTLVWEKKKKPSFLDAGIGCVTESILVYAKDRGRAAPLSYGLTTRGKKYPINNAGNGVRVLRFPAGSVGFRCRDGHFEPGDMSEGNIVTRLLDPVTVAGGRNVEAFRLEGEFRYGQATLDAIVAAGETIVISKAPFRPNHVKRGGAPKKLKNLLTIAHYGMSTYEDATRESEALFGRDAFDYPKPERLLEVLLGASTKPGDWVLDPFAGSGTTGAVAHKMGRSWAMIEEGPHCESHAATRMRAVVEGRDPGGVSDTFGFRGGGSFRFFRVR
jgi:adenine-specific DNA-methyltransferase